MTGSLAPCTRRTGTEVAPGTAGASTASRPDGDMLFLREAAKAGAGIALLPSFLALANVTSGQLVRVMPRYTLSTTSLTMLHPRAQHAPRKVSAFRDVLIDFLQARPLSGPPSPS
ncbi:hypothetical protein FH620_22795 [Corallococcus exiguus]|nr:hypothetical protein FH620_22795 [Corallococcus exiguus]